MVKKNLKLAHAPQLLKLDLGAGKGLNTPEGFTPIDKDVADLTKRWPWKSNSVDEAQANYLLQYLTADERIHFANELFRVLRPGARCVIFTPYWSAGKAYGDLAAKFPPVVEHWYPFLNKVWREAQSYRVEGYTCDFEFTVGYGLHPATQARHEERRQWEMAFAKEAVQELVVTLTKL